MSTTMRNVDTAFFHVIHKAVFVIYSTTEFALQISGQRLWFSNSIHASIALNVFDELVDALQIFLS